MFDGHAGIEAALFASKHIHCNLVHNCDLDKNPAEASKASFKVTDEQYIPKAKKEVRKGIWWSFRELWFQASSCLDHVFSNDTNTC